MIIQGVDLILAICGLVCSGLSLAVAFWIGLSSARQRQLGHVVLAESFAILSAALAEEKREKRRAETP